MLAEPKSGCSGWPASGARRSIPCGMLRQPYSGVTYSPRTMSLAACHNSGDDPTTNAATTRQPTARARDHASLAGRTRTDGRQVTTIAAIAAIHATVSTFCGVRADTATSSTQNDRPPVARIAAANAAPASATITHTARSRDWSGVNGDVDVANAIGFTHATRYTSVKNSR